MTIHIWRSRKTLLIIWKFVFAHKKYEKNLNFQFHRCFVKNSKASDGSRQWEPDLSWFDRFLRRLYHRWSTCLLVFGSWLLDHMIYLKLRKEELCAKLSKFTIWHSKWLLFWVKIVVILWIWSALQAVISFSAWDKTCDSTANSQKLEDM